jgi:hypothetical protein
MISEPMNATASLDGGSPIIRTLSKPLQTQYKQPVFDFQSLQSANHVLEITLLSYTASDAPSDHSSVVDFDYLSVRQQVLLDAQEPE